LSLRGFIIVAGQNELLGESTALLVQPPFKPAVGLFETVGELLELAGKPHFDDFAPATQNYLSGNEP
jgi:hypothetical protein